jgi:2-hydroxychromene-2-carboxylate isomerase
MADIEYFYSAHSAFAYLGSALFMEIAGRLERRIVHKPVDLRKLVATSSGVPFAKRSAAHYQYYFGREIERWSQWRNAPVMSHPPTHHHADTTLANCMLIAGLRQGLDMDQLAHAMLCAHWRDDADLSNRETLLSIGEAVGPDPEPLLQDALSDESQRIYQANTQEAIDRSVFGSPTYVLDGDMFYGQDHLEMLERAAGKPFARFYSL